MMGPPKNMIVKKRKQKRDYVDSPHSHSMPTTPNLENRATHRSSDPEGSDSDYGFTNWGN